jgi:hypothetical protein
MFSEINCSNINRPSWSLALREQCRQAQLPGDNIGQRCRFRHDNSNYFVVPSNTFRRRMAMIIYKRGQQLVLDLVV